MKVAIIPARGGSKRIPRKNIKEFFGKPMIAWSIEAARKSGCFDEIIVSTDDLEIADVATEWGAAVPFLRPAELADDFTGTKDVVAHAVHWLGSHRSSSPNLVCCIYATAPFLAPEDIIRGYELISAGRAAFALSVTTFDFPIQRALRIGPDRYVQMMEPRFANTRSQDLEVAYHDAGQFYWGRRESWSSDLPLNGPSSVAVELPKFRVQDIDTVDDWRRAELMFSALNCSNVAGEVR